MYAKLEEEYGLAKRAMSVYERATQVVADEDKFEVGFAICTFPAHADSVIYRCSQYTSPRLQKIMVSLLFGQSMNAL